MTTTVVLLASYVIGSVPFAFIAGRMVSGVDLREQGSGSVGATNLLRTTARASLAVIVAGLDVLKGLAAVFLARGLDVAPPWVAAAAVVAIAGHVYPVWLGWRGGKGVATMCGAFLALAPFETVLAVSAFALVAGVTRRVSPASLLSTVVLVGLAWFRSPADVAAAAAAASALVWWKHRANLVRLLAGTERPLWKAE